MTILTKGNTDSIIFRLQNLLHTHFVPDISRSRCYGCTETFKWPKWVCPTVRKTYKQLMNVLYMTNGWAETCIPPQCLCCLSCMAITVKTTDSLIHLSFLCISVLTRSFTSLFCFIYNTKLRWWNIHWNSRFFCMILMWRIKDVKGFAISILISEFRLHQQFLNLWTNCVQLSFRQGIH